jgi:hypothetical protein
MMAHASASPSATSDAMSRQCRLIDNSAPAVTFS